jgi:hypothetical protein
MHKRSKRSQYYVCAQDNLQLAPWLKIRIESKPITQQRFPRGGGLSIPSVLHFQMEGTVAAVTSI